MRAETVAKYTLIALIPVVLILGNFRLLAFDKDFYYDEINKNGVDIENARERTAEIIDYLKTGEAINSKISKDELTHLGDVRSLMRTYSIILYLSSALAAGAFAFLTLRQKKLALSQLYYGGITTAAIIAILLLASTVAFDQAFFVFHKLLFRNDLWLLPPESTLIRLLPQEFFIDFAKRLSLNTMLMSFLLILIGRMKR